MKIVIPGGSGQVGAVLSRAFRARGDDVVVLSRRGTRDRRIVEWDGRTLGPWADAIEGADVVINLAGRSVNCRYTAANLETMMNSRVDSTRVVGLAIEKAARPPSVWLQMSTATIYAHRFDAPNDEATGHIGGHEPDVPAYWKFSIDIAMAWERTQKEAKTPRTRGTGRPDRGRASVHVLDPRARLRSCRRIPRWPRRHRWCGESRCAEPRASAGVHGHAAVGVGNACWTASDEVDGRNRRFLF